MTHMSMHILQADALTKALAKDAFYRHRAELSLARTHGSHAHDC